MPDQQRDSLHAAFTLGFSRRRPSDTAIAQDAAEAASTQWRTDVVGILPDNDATIRFEGALLLAQNNNRAVRRVCDLGLETIAPMVDGQNISLPAAAHVSIRPETEERKSSFEESGFCALLPQKPKTELMLEIKNAKNVDRFTF